MLRKIERRPRLFLQGEVAFGLPEKYVRTRHELALTVTLMANRRLFSLFYGGLLSKYFENMPINSGVFITAMVPTKLVMPSIIVPGDIDMLVIPYEGDALILDETLAVEIKAVRATYAKQGRSPNQMGTRQVLGLHAMGFPYSALAHLIVSDESPQSEWKPIGIAKVLDDHGRVELLSDRPFDWMPIDLTHRALKRLEKLSLPQEIGLAASYLGSKDHHFSMSDRFWIPQCRSAEKNAKPNTELLRLIGELFHAQTDRFFDTPRFDPI